MKKAISILLCLALALGFASAFAETKEYNTVEPGKFIYATSPDFLPFEGRDDQDNVIGIEPDLVALICEKLGLTAEAYPIDFDSALAAPAAGTVDAVVSGVTIREDRKAVLDFTIPYATITQAIAQKAGSGITMDNLGEKTIGVQNGTTGHIYAVDDFGEDHVVAYSTYALAFQALQNGQVDCVLLDDLVANDFAKKMKFDENGFQTSEVGGTSATYWCDYWYQNSGLRYAFRGGSCGYSTGRVGAFFVALTLGPTAADWAIGAAPSCKPLS
jgi:polar amino acid transport system substrate-binding protein